MADNSTDLQIIIRATSAEALAAFQALAQAQAGLQSQTQAGTAATAAHGAATESALGSMARMATSIAAGIGLWTSFSAALSGTKRALEDMITASDQYNRSAIEQAALITALAKNFGPETFGQALRYSRGEMENLYEVSARFGVKMNELTILSNRLALQGVFPTSKQDYESIAQIASVIDAMTSGSGGMMRSFRLAQEIEALFTGQVTSTSIVARIIKSTEPDLQAWVDHHRDANDLLEAIAAKLHATGQLQAELGTTASYWKNRLEEAYRLQIQIGAAAPFYDAIRDALKSITQSLVDSNGQLTPFGQEVRDLAGTAFKELATAARDFVQAIVDHKDEILGFFSGMLDFARQLSSVLGDIGGIVRDQVGSALRDLQNDPVVRFLINTKVSGGEMFGMPGAPGITIGPGLQGPGAGPFGTPGTTTFGGQAVGGAAAGLRMPALDIPGPPETTPAPRPDRAAAAAAELKAAFTIARDEADLTAKRTHESTAQQIDDLERLRAKFSQTAFERKTLATELLQLDIHIADLRDAAQTKAVDELIRSPAVAAAKKEEEDRLAASVRGVADREYLRQQELNNARAYQQGLTNIYTAAAKQEENDRAAAALRAVKIRDEQFKQEISDAMTAATTLISIEQLRVAQGLADTAALQAARQALLDQLNASLAVTADRAKRLQLDLQILQISQEIARTDAARSLGTAFEFVAAELKAQSFDWVKAVESAAQQMSSSMSTVFFNAMTGQLTDLGSFFRAIINSMEKTIADFLASQVTRSLFGFLTQAFGGGGITTVAGASGLTGGLGIVGGAGFGVATRMQAGGIVSSPTFAMIGEAGPEAVIPLRGGKVPVQASGGGGDTHVHMTVYANDASSFLDMIARNRHGVATAIAAAVRENHPIGRQFIK